jgi:hypothetical protein
VNQAAPNNKGGSDSMQASQRNGKNIVSHLSGQAVGGQLNVQKVDASALSTRIENGYEIR